MCGIVGYAGRRPAAPLLLAGLQKLEYRGYDSAGIALLTPEGVRVVKTAGHDGVMAMEILAGQIDRLPAEATTGIGHTRWATHGRPTDNNAHPHLDTAGEFAVVHNGIIENYLPLRARLREAGCVFQSETDSETVVHLLAHYYRGDLAEALRRTLADISGSFALVGMCRHHPGQLVAARRNAPLIVGAGAEGDFFVASDIPAVLTETREVYVLEDGEMAVVSDGAVSFSDFAGTARAKTVMRVTWDAAAAEKGGYEHFMLKEIDEQPRALQDTLYGRVNRSGLVDLGIRAEFFAGVERVALVGCGTAYHAGLIGRELLEAWAQLPAETAIASEFRYRRPLLDEHTLVVLISQSGETADTLAALHEARKNGARVLVVTNVVGSTAAREADEVLFTWAGPEIAVASTKAYTTQLEVMVLLALYLATARGRLAAEYSAALLAELQALPAKITEILSRKEQLRRMAVPISRAGSAFFIGRGLDWAVALEGALKLKEISYIHAEAYAAGELKHGTLALVTADTPVLAVATQRALYDKTLSNVEEVKAREGRVLAVAASDNRELGDAADEVFWLPPVSDALAPLVTIVPLQLIAYYAAVLRGNHVDKPRNLAKTVTTE
ncbi:MAG: glutamine--fructose-6-phosphate transaminase (isomerizing) [Gracilibacteraceae bacterium]|jgi:glucosamine--fructose-6-phosphate aminotransferase (isomerizing)|nr:glutamine--fructose-6-phosphate transaminase (isomerizing) [Gracilibacteraceae bacterium]